MGIFDGLESLGLGGLGKVDIYAEEETEKQPEVKKVNAPKLLDETDFLLDREYECPVCDKKFKQRMMRQNKARLVSQDRLLRPVFNGIDSTKYDVILCPYCGYAVVSRYYAALAKPHRQLIKDNISANFKQMSTEVPERIGYEEAFTRYKLALFNAVVRQGKSSEKAFICLKTAWLLRGWEETLDEDSIEGKKLLLACRQQEKEYIKNALEGFMKARTTEQSPYAGMNEVSLDYLIGALALECGEHLQDGARVLGNVITSQSAGEKLKERAREVLLDLRKELKEDQA